MSARPRPVTATVRPPKPLTSTPKAHRYSLSSGSSTESLLSVLNHESCESLLMSDEEVEEVKVIQENTKKTDKPKVHDDSHTHRSNISNPATENKTDEKADASSPENDAKLSPWEQWLIQKTKEFRLHQKEEAEKQRKEEEEAERIKQEKAEKLKSQEGKINEWIERKNMLEKMRKKETKVKELTEKEIKEQEKKKIEEKATVKYKEWLIEKRKQQKEEKKREREKQKQEQEEKAERQKKCEEVFEAWCKKAQNRPRSAPQSFGYMSGKLTGYHDTNAYPIPSFYNPIPWQPIHVPTVKTERKKRKKKATWNPKKYL